jgi:hypothetical protein
MNQEQERKEIEQYLSTGNLAKTLNEIEIQDLKWELQYYKEIVLKQKSEILTLKNQLQILNKLLQESETTTATETETENDEPIRSITPTRAGYFTNLFLNKMKRRTETETETETTTKCGPNIYPYAFTQEYNVEENKEEIMEFGKAWEKYLQEQT